MELREKEMHYSADAMKYRANEVLERQEESQAFVDAVTQMQDQQEVSLDEEIVKNEITNLINLSNGDLQDLFYQSRPTVEDWAKIRPFLSYPRIQLDMEYDPMAAMDLEGNDTELEGKFNEDF